jgi:putative transposase
VLTYCIMSNHFHVLVQVDDGQKVSDTELLRRYKVLYPKPTKYQEASVQMMEQTLAQGGEEAEAIRRKLRARMGDVSEFMKAVKQRFSVWYNRTHNRRGTLWMDRFKSVLVEGKGNPLQTMAAYIDLNPVRAGIVEDPKDYRFCGYAEAVSGAARSRSGLRFIWKAYAAGGSRKAFKVSEALQMHRSLMFGRRASQPGLTERSRKQALKVLEEENGHLSKAVVLRCRVRYFPDGAILGSEEFVRGFVGAWQMDKGRKYPPKPNPMRGTNWGGLTTIQGLRREVFG